MLQRSYKQARSSRVGGLMADRRKVKITVLKRLSTKEIFGDSPPMGQAVEPCEMFKVGQEFISGEDGRMPEGFCHWAWNDLYKSVTTLRFGGNYPRKEKGTSISCCTDGFRPVIFKVERIE